MPEATRESDFVLFPRVHTQAMIKAGWCGAHDEKRSEYVAGHD